MLSAGRLGGRAPEYATDGPPGRRRLFLLCLPYGLKARFAIDGVWYGMQMDVRPGQRLQCSEERHRSEHEDTEGSGGADPI